MHIDSYDFGRILIDSKEYDKDVIIFPDHVFSPWWRNKGHYLGVADIPEDLLAEDPETVIVGTGYTGLMEVSPEIEELFKSKGVELIIGKTIDAWKTYNSLRQNRKVIALFHLTC